MGWLSANWVSLLVIAVIIAAVILAVRSIIRDRRSGKGSCCCGCSGCAMADTCHKEKRQEKKR
ncbi:MAG: FeoB-associated Cys-rich membrane protein [Clostridiales bacterium]|nr:FeoB-associated Cys-rich membrane protein [Clostridiales bacterium]